MVDKVNPALSAKGPRVASQPETVSEAQKLLQDIAQINQATSDPNAMAAMNISRERGNSLTGDNAVIQDYSTLTPVQFQNRYGMDAYDQMVAAGIGAAHARDLAGSSRDLGQIARDSALDVANGALGGIGGLNDFLIRGTVAGPIGDRLLQKNAENVQGGREFIDSFKTTPTKRLDYVDSIRTELDRIDNEKLTKQDASDDQGIVDSFRTYGKSILRDAGAGVERYAEDPSRLGSDVGEGVGSLLLGGAASKALSVGASGVVRATAPTSATSRFGAEAVDAAIQRAAFPLSIGAMEGGGASTQAILEVMEMPEEALLEQPAYQEMLSEGLSPADARSRLAARSGAIAASIAAPVAAATSKLVSRFEQAPFSGGSGSVVGNSAREFVEEGIQSGAGELAGNIGLKFSGADQDASLVEGVGSASVQGAIAGAGTAGAIQGPSAVLRNAAKAAGSTFKFAGDTVKKRGEKILANISKESAVSEESLAPALEAATTQATSVGEGLRKLATENSTNDASVEDYISRVERAVQTDEQDLYLIPDSMGPVLTQIQQETGRVPNRFETLTVAAATANNEALSQEERVAAATFLLKHIENNKKLFTEDFPEFLDNVPHDRPEFQAFEGYAGILSTIEQVPAIQQAIGWARQEMQAPESDVSKVDLNSDDGRKIVERTVELATVAPQAINLKAAEDILFQADEGTLNLSPERRRILRGATSLINAARAYAAQVRVMEPGVLEEQSEDLQQELDETRDRDEMMEFIGRQIEKDGGPKAHQTSLRDHVAGISLAASQGDMKTARRKAQRLVMFAMSHANKVSALSQSIRNGDGKNVPYKALAASDEFYTNKKGVGVRIGNPGSERFARKVQAEAMAIAQLANDISNQYPEFGLRQVEVSDLGLQNVEVGQREPAPAEQTELPQATTAEQVQVRQEELPLPRSQPAQEPSQATSEETSVDASSTVAAEKVVSETVDEATAGPEDTGSGPAAASTSTELQGGYYPAEVTDQSSDRVSELLDGVSEDVDYRPTTAEEYPDLVAPNGNNWFHKSFRSPENLKSRVVWLTNPIKDFKRILSKSSELVSFMGNPDLRYDVNGQDAAGFRKLLSLADPALEAIENRLKARLKKDGLLEKIGQGLEVNRFRDLRVLNLMRQDGTGYNTQLVETAVIAGLDWAINMSSRAARMTVSEVASIMGVDEADAAPYVEEFNRGMSMDIAKRSLADRIVQFWGVEPEKSARDGLTKGIPEAMAAEVLHGLEAAGLLELGIEKKDGEDKRLAFPHLTEKKFNRVLFDTRTEEMEGLIRSLDGKHDLLADMVLVNREVEDFSIGEPVTDIDQRQLRNPMVALSNQQKKTLEHVQSTPYFPNQVVYDFYQTLGEEAYVTMMSGHPYQKGDLEKTHVEMGLNRIHWESIKGRQRGLVSDFRNVTKQMTAVRRKGENVPTYYKHHINKLGRTQMAGLSNPQTSKLAREIFMPTRSELDLSENAPDMDKFLMTVGQGIGLKTEKETRADIVIKVMEKTMTEGGEFYQTVQNLKSWLQQRENDQGQDIDLGVFEDLRSHGLSDHGLHSLIAVARYELASETGGDLSKFEVFNYLEADGKTNGPINALMTLAAGKITPAWLNAVGKGGAFFGRLNKTLNSHEDKVDLYEESSTETQVQIVELNAALAESDESSHELFIRFKRFLSALEANVEIDSNGEITIKRGLTKNPLTITIYGSGAKGIAGKVTDEIVNAIYENLSKSIQDGKHAGELIYGDGKGSDFMSDLVELTSKVVLRSKDSEEYFVMGETKEIGGSSQNFTFNREQYSNLRQNVLTFLVNPMRLAIDKKVTGHVGRTTSAVQQATQIQSIFLKGMTIDKVTRRLAEMKNDPDKFSYREGEFLNRNEQQDIQDNLKRFSPIIDTGTQAYMMSGGERSDLFEKTVVDIDGKPVEVTMPETFSRSLSGDMKTPAYFYGPTLAGVRAIPTLVVGSGDGQMMLNFLSGNPEAARRVLHVFDGLNMPADAIDDYSRLVNQAVFQTWTSDKNPVRAAYESFKAFVEASPIEELFPGDQMNDQQKQALLELSQVALDRFEVAEGDIIDTETVSQLLNLTLDRLERLANETDARRQVYAEFDLSVDQMASGESPFVNEGSIKLEENTSIEDIAYEMQARYEEILTNQTKPKTEKTSVSGVESPNQKLEEFIQSVANTNENGALVLDPDQLSAMPDKILNSSQKQVLSAAVKSLAGAGYRLVFGTPSVLDAWEQANNADRFLPGSNNGYGKIDPISKVVLVSNTSGETLVHELVHAATFMKVKAAFEDPKAIPKEDLEAVARIEGLMAEWLAQDFSEFDEAAQDARRQAVATVEGYHRRGQTAQAVNEFMAWVLGNQNLSRAALLTKVKNPLAKIARNALAALKKLVFGTDKVDPVHDDLMSNLRFNTQVLMATPTPIELLRQDYNDMALYQSATFGNDQRISELRDLFGRKIIAWVKGSGTDVINRLQSSGRAVEALDAYKAGFNTARAFGYHFDGLGNMQANSTFASIQAALMTEMDLNSNSLSRIEELYNHVMGQLSPSSFQEKPDQNDPNDLYQAQGKFNVLSGIYINETDKLGRSSLMSSFLALAMVDDGFRKILAGMNKPENEQSQDRTLDGLLENAANAGLDRLSLYLAGEKKQDKSVQEALDSLTIAMIENVGDQRAFVEQQTETFFEQVEEKVANSIQETSARVAEKSADVARNSNSRTVKAGATIVNVFSTMINEQKSSDAMLGMVSWLNQKEGMELIRDTVGNFIGRTRENAGVFDMISKVRAQVQQVRQNFREDLPVKLSKEFSRPPTAKQWTAMYNALGRSDIASLVRSYGVGKTVDLVADTSKIDAEVQKLERQIQADNASRFPKIKEKSLQLAKFMMTGEHGPQLLRNAEAIARLLGERGLALRTAPSQELVESIDKLVTLYALQGLDDNSRADVTTLLGNTKDRSGVEFVTSYLVGQRNDELAKVGSNKTASFNHYKGHIPSEVQQGGSLRIASETSHAEMVSRGYTRVASYDGSSADRTRGKRAYYFAPVSSQAPFSQGVMQTVHQTVSGIDPETGFTIGEVMGGRIENIDVVKIIARQVGNQKTTNENLLPVFGDNGEIVAFERGADVSKLQGLNRSTDLSQMIGVWRGRQAEELLATEVNKQLVDALKDTWEEGRKAGRKDEFVNIAALGSKKSDDRILSEAARLIPNQTRDYIKEVFGGDQFMVRRDMLLDTFGARQASVGDLFTGKTRWNQKVVNEFEKVAVGIFGKHAYVGAVSAEKNIQELVSNAKTMIVVKSGIVPAANMISNLFQLLNRGVPLRHILAGVPAKTVEINSYIKNRHREIGIEADLRAAMGRRDLVQIRRLENQLKGIQDGYRRMSIWPLIEAGEFSAISNGQVTAEDLAVADGKWTDWIENKINTLPGGFRTAARYGLITRDTALFQGLAKAVQYGDFVAKAVLYDDMTRRKKAKKEDAIATVNEAFVNYNKLAGRDRQYLESVGLLWFWNYKIRIMKEAVHMLRHNPLRSLLMTGVPVGTPVGDNIVSVILEDRLGWSIGPGMGWNSVSLNPWINLTR
jgi:hypothetical protein